MGLNSGCNETLHNIPVPASGCSNLYRLPLGDLFLYLNETAREVIGFTMVMIVDRASLETQKLLRRGISHDIST